MKLFEAVPKSVCGVSFNTLRKKKTSGGRQDAPLNHFNAGEIRN